MPGPGRARFAFATLRELYQVLPRVYALAVSLPDGPLQTFLEKTRELPRTTEAERLVVQRIGQDIFREGLMAYWAGRCPLTGITEPALLRASHIKPWARCETDTERLDVHNGLLLCPVGRRLRRRPRHLRGRRHAALRRGPECRGPGCPSLECPFAVDTAASRATGLAQGERV